MGRFDFSPETIRLFLERKQKDIAARNIAPWKKVFIYVERIKIKTMDSERCQQILDLVSQKKAEGLNVVVSFEDTKKHIYSLLR